MQLPIHSVRVTTAISYSSSKVNSGEAQEVAENARINDKLGDRHTITSRATESTSAGDRNPDGRYHQGNVNDLKDPFSVLRCRTIMNCVDVCPKKLNPTKVINKIRTMMLKDNETKVK